MIFISSKQYDLLEEKFMTIIYLQGYGFLSFAKNMVKNVGKSKSKNLSGNYSQKLLHHAKQK